MRVASVVFNYFTNDSRVEKQAISLGLLGLEVLFLLFGKMVYPLNRLIKITEFVVFHFISGGTISNYSEYLSFVN